ncbi:MAG: ATP-binding protein [Methyloligellaceae bacterium]
MIRFKSLSFPKIRWNSLGFQGVNFRSLSFPMIRFNSLAFRLVVLSAAWSLFVLPVTALALRYVYQDSVKKNFRGTLLSELTALAGQVASAEKDAQGKLSIKLLSPEYGFPLSGRYWQARVLNPKQGEAELYHSESLQAEDLLDLPSNSIEKPDDNGVYVGEIRGPEKQNLYAAETNLEIGEGEDRRWYSLVVTFNWDIIRAEVDDFTIKLSWALFVLGLGLVIAPFVQVNLGLRPLRVISSRLTDIRSGKADKLTGKLPTEIQPLQTELNALIHSNKEIVERARMHVGNLAHALKTPLSVISNEANAQNPNYAEKVIEQSEIMRDQITHYLDRARMAARINVIGGLTEIGPTLDALVRTLQRIHEDRDIIIETKYLGTLKFQGEKQDLEEMVGNLLENACKWTNGIIELKVKVVEEGEEEKAMLHIHIDDNGPGLSEVQMKQAVKRGQRLDESKPGSGLGLSIVAELAHLYNGKFFLQKSNLGGLRAVLQLPKA